MKQLLVSTAKESYNSYIIDTSNPTKHALVYVESLFKWDESIFTNEEIQELSLNKHLGYFIAWVWS